MLLMMGRERAKLYYRSKAQMKFLYFMVVNADGGSYEWGPALDDQRIPPARGTTTLEETDQRTKETNRGEFIE
jgi:hypothetical protein